MFISFEGGEGCGKTTASKNLYEYLKTRNVDVVWTREIGGTYEAEKIRDIILNNKLLTKSELLLVMAARIEHIENFIKPCLQEGKWIICDRFVDSTACYQGNFLDEDIANIYDLHKQIIGNFWPEKTFLLSLDPKIALQRALERGDNNKFEEKPFEFHQKIHDIFLKIALKFPNRISVINSDNKNPEMIIDEIVKNLPNTN